MYQGYYFKGFGAGPILETNLTQALVKKKPRAYAQGLGCDYYNNLFALPLPVWCFNHYKETFYLQILSLWFAGISAKDFIQKCKQAEAIILVVRNIAEGVKFIYIIMEHFVHVVEFN